MPKIATNATCQQQDKIRPIFQYKALMPIGDSIQDFQQLH